MHAHVVVHLGEERKAVSQDAPEAGAWLVRHYADLEVYLLVLDSNASARRFYERLGGENAGVSVMETHGGAIVRSCRYVWPRARHLAAS